eukprot:s1112_g5.t1
MFYREKSSLDCTVWWDKTWADSKQGVKYVIKNIDTMPTDRLMDSHVDATAEPLPLLQKDFLPIHAIEGISNAIAVCLDSWFTHGQVAKALDIAGNFFYKLPFRLMTSGSCVKYLVFSCPGFGTVLPCSFLKMPVFSSWSACDCFTIYNVLYHFAPSLLGLLG